ncbi:hypothetical protein HCH15_03510 [Corynebacterium testudinoris]|uniref:DNA polymerase n=1 Tax=Corynebacterium testudinoris TaxID=136857 RepID=UPI001C8C84D5|nr:DNA polymerase [Corynebacterium testudinoris]MBX8995252.1 hypothetical protein [Corynebacterium testudinoris]
MTDDIGELLTQFEQARFIVGHNILGFDLPALERYHALDVESLVAANKVLDTLLVARQCDPPRAGGVDGGRYSLGSLGARLVGKSKLEDADDTLLKSLAEEYGGYDAIPTNDDRYRAYAAQDVELTRQIAAKLRIDGYARREHTVMWRVGQIERSGLRVDIDAAEQRIEAQRRLLDRDFQRLRDIAGVPLRGKAPHLQAAGKAAIAATFQRLGVDPPRTKKGALALNQEALSQLVEHHPGNTGVNELVDILQKVGRQRTFAETVLKHVSHDRVHPAIRADQATGRISVTKPGLTTMGKRERQLVLERALILPDTDDEVLIAADLSQIDARAMAVLSGDPRYIRAFAEEEDYHSAMAEALFGAHEWNRAGHHPRRSEAKVVVHATTYGMGALGLSKAAGIDENEAKRLLERLDMQFPALASYKRVIRETAEKKQVLRTPHGRTVRIEPGREWTQAPAAMGQGTARDLMMDGILRLPNWLASRLRLIVHDEVVLSVPRDRIDEASTALLDALQFDFSVSSGSTVPVRAGLSAPGRDWADCYRDEVPWPETAWEHRQQDSCDDPECTWHEEL